VVKHPNNFKFFLDRSCFNDGYIFNILQRNRGIVILLPIMDIFNAQSIILIVTRIIDIFVVFVIGVSAFQIFVPLLLTVIKFKEKNNDGNNIIKRFISSLLLALELESANAILKMGLFISNNASNDYLSEINNNNLIFFVAVLSVRIAINQTLKRYNIKGP
jgi:hypothetical protein